MKGTVLIAGGTGLIGQELQALLIKNNFTVRVLTRRASNESKNLFHWNPIKKEIDEKALHNVTHIINLAGESVAGKRWTKTRKAAIISSRTVPAAFLYQLRDKMPLLQQYLTASGINAYGYNKELDITENESRGTDFLSEVVKKWEETADAFEAVVPVCKLRIGVVFAKAGGALQQLVLPIKWFVGSPIGNGKQNIPWIDSADLCQIFLHAIQQNLSGAYNCSANNISNEELTKTIATLLKRPLFLPKVPAFVMRILLGEMADIVLKGLHPSNEKLLQSGFKFQFDLSASLNKNLVQK